MSRFKFALVLLASLCVFAASDTRRRVTVASGGPTVAFNDQFGADTTGWATRSGATDCSFSSGELSMTGKGLCRYTGSESEGSHPSTDDQWAMMEFGVTAISDKGPALRTQSGVGDPGNSIFNYILRCSGAELIIRNCRADSDCLTIADGGTCTQDNNDLLAFMVAGQGDNTELCAWYFDALAHPTDLADPDTWGVADFCTNESGSPLSLLTLYEATTVEDWDDVSATGPDDLWGFPVTSQFEVGLYNGTTSNWTVEGIIAGDLNL